MLDNQISSLFSSYSTLMQKASSEIKMVEKLSAYEGKSSTLIVTDDCNLRCSYCYIHQKVSNKIMTWEVAKDFIDYIFEKDADFADIPIEKQTQFDHGKIWEFIGGEPFLEYKLIFKCMDYIIEKTAELPAAHPWKRGFPCASCEKHGKPSHIVPGYRFSFSTNGTLFNNPEIRQGLEKYGEELVSVNITIDGPKEMHDLCRRYTDGRGSFDDVMSYHEWYKRIFPNNTGSKSTISHDNLPYISKVAKFFWEDLKIPYVMMNCVFENVWYRGDQLLLFDQLCDLADYLLVDERYKKIGIRWFDPIHGTKDTSDRKWCGSGTHMDACGSDGTLYPCLRFKTLDNHPPYTIGHIYTGGKDASILANFEVDNCHTSNVQKTVTGVDCGSCPISSLCASCQAFSYDVYNRLDVKAAFICPMHKATVFANIYFFGNILGIITKEDRDYLLLLLNHYTKDDYFGFDEEGAPVSFFKGNEA